MAEVKVERGSPAEFKVGPSSAPAGLPAPDRRPFEVITHTTHVLSAVEVLRTGKFEPRLVYDKSNLNDHRIPVVWLSPNRWTIGYRYGTVQFAFPFDALWRGRRAYWVEVARYTIPAPRILLTDKDRTGHPALTPYDPTTRNGPWWFDGTRHYFNGHNICVEFMVEGEVQLADVSEVGFVDHHAKYCCVTPTNPSTCRELGKTADVGARRFLSRVASEDLAACVVPYADGLAQLCEGLVLRFAKQAKAGTVTATDKIADAVARAAFAAHGTYRDDEAKALMGLFCNEVEAEKVCWRVLAAALGRTVEQIKPSE